MMDRKTLTETMGMRFLRPGEVLSSGYALLSNRFGSYLLLSFLVYLPVNLINQYFAMQVDLTPLLENQTDYQVLMSDYQTLMSQYAHLIVAQAVTMYLTLVAALVCAVIVKNQLFDEENRSFGRNFYMGVRMWPRGALTLILIMIELIIGIIGSAMLMIIPLIGLISIALLLAIVFIFQMNFSLCSAAAATRGMFGFNNLRFVRILNMRYYGQTLGMFVIITLISNGISLVVSLLTGNLLTFSSNQWVMLGMSTLVSTILSILEIYGFVCGAIVYLNLEELKRPNNPARAGEMKEEVDSEDDFRV